MKTLGCRLNEAELETWSRQFQECGHSLTQSLERADLVVVNSCAVTGEAVRKSRKAMHRAHNCNPEAKLVVSGCYASLEPQSAAQEMGVDLVVSNQDKDRLVEIVSRELDLKSMPQMATEPGVNSLLARGRQRAFVKVQDGCRYNCTFCIVTEARGDERSKSLAEVVDEVHRLHSEGIQEVVLTGVHIGGYGSDLGSSLSELVQTVLEQTDIPRIRLGAVEPWDLEKEFWELFQNPRFMPHLHLPLQSGSDDILRRMARRCKSDEFTRLVTDARASIPHFNITTDVIVGFPGEGENEWQESLEFIRNTGFGHLHIFAFSPRTGTLAAEMPKRVTRDTIRERSQELHELGMEMKRRVLEQNLNNRFEVLIEGREQCPDMGVEAWSGYTPNFIRVKLPCDNNDELENKILQLELVEIGKDGTYLQGKVIGE